MALKSLVSGRSSEMARGRVFGGLSRDLCLGRYTSIFLCQQPRANSPALTRCARTCRHFLRYANYVSGNFLSCWLWARPLCLNFGAEKAPLVGSGKQCKRILSSTDQTTHTFYPAARPQNHPFLLLACLHLKDTTDKKSLGRIEAAQFPYRTKKDQKTAGRQWTVPL